MTVPASASAVPAPAGSAQHNDSPAALKQKLRRAERVRKLRAMGLIAPLFFFLLITFVVPILDMMRRSVHDTELSTVWPTVTAAMDSWKDRGNVPDEAVFAALAKDLRAAGETKTLAVAARRLNYAVDNGRSLVFGTARRLPVDATNWKETLIGIEPRWGQVATWNAINQASGPLTTFYLLAALDREKLADGSIVKAPEQSSIYVDILERTFTVSLSVTLLCLVLGFPVAYLLATLPAKHANILMILVLLPFWTSLLVRTAAWVVLLQEQGLVNELLLALGIIEKPIRMIYNRIGVYIAMTHILLPFMILPLYSVMKGIKPHFMRAATSLGATPTEAFVRVYLPMTLPGIGAGALLTFILALGYYITPALVGGAADQMISFFIAFYTSDTVNWGMASALGAVLLVATLVLYSLYNRLVGISNMRLG
ncbi:ABC transporter permease [Novispirillum itersonii]|uniref:ABC transporter permease n=1 Tax=Novispirillum itersonii TaxID=189 RepID=UPI0006858CB3